MTDCSSGPVWVKSGHCEGKRPGGAVSEVCRGMVRTRRTYGVDLEQVDSELVIDQEIDTKDLEGIGQRLHQFAGRSALRHAPPRITRAANTTSLTWNPEPAPTAALNVSATATPTFSSIFSTLSSPNASPSCGPARILRPAIPCSSLTATSLGSCPGAVCKHVLVKCEVRSTWIDSESSSTAGYW